MSKFFNSLGRELGKNTGKWISNALFNDKHATPYKLITQRENDQRRQERINAREYKARQRQLEKARLENEREIKRLEKRDAELRKSRMIESNKREVSESKKYLEVIQSVHKDYSEFVDWYEIRATKKPEEVKTAEEIKVFELNRIDSEIAEKVKFLRSSFNFSFGRLIFVKIFGDKFSSLSKILFKENHQKEISIKRRIQSLEKSKVEKLAEALNLQKTKREEYEEKLKQYNGLMNIAEGVLNRESNSFLYAIKLFEPFQDIEAYGSDLAFSVSEGNIVIDFYVHGDEVLPKTEKKLLRKGVEVKETPIRISKFNEIYQDYVCSCVLRIAKEVFLLLPIKEVLIFAHGSILNSATGNYEDKAILKVLIVREILDTFNFDLLDPSDSMSNFQHEMKFSRTKGFTPI